MPSSRQRRAAFVADPAIGIGLTGIPWNEKQLIEIACAFEHAHKARHSPDL